MAKHFGRYESYNLDLGLGESVGSVEYGRMMCEAPNSRLHAGLKDHVCQKRKP